MDLVSELREHIVREFLRGADPSAIGPGDDLTRLLDSMHFMLLARHLEEAYGITVADDEIALTNFESLEKLSEFVRRKRG